MQTLDSVGQTLIDNKIYESHTLDDVNISTLADALHLKLDYEYDEITSQEYSDDLLGIDNKNTDISSVGRVDYGHEGEATFFTIKLKPVNDEPSKRYYCYIRCEGDPRQSDSYWIEYILNTAPGAKDAKILIGYQDSESPYVIADVTILAELYT